MSLPEGDRTMHPPRTHHACAMFSHTAVKPIGGTQAASDWDDRDSAGTSDSGCEPTHDGAFEVSYQTRRSSHGHVGDQSAFAGIVYCLGPGWCQKGLMWARQVVTSDSLPTKRLRGSGAPSGAPVPILHPPPESTGQNVQTCVYPLAHPCATPASTLASPRPFCPLSSPGPPRPSSPPLGRDRPGRQTTRKRPWWPCASGLLLVACDPTLPTCPRRWK